MSKVVLWHPLPLACKQLTGGGGSGPADAPTIREWNPESLTRSPKSFPTARRTPTSLLDTESKAELNRQLEEWEREIGVLMQEEGSEPKSLKDTLATYLFTKGSEASRTLQRMGKVG